MPVIKHLDGVCHVYIDAARGPRDGGRASPTTRRRSATAPATRWRRCWCTPTIAQQRPAAARRSIYARQGRRAARATTSRARRSAPGDEGRAPRRTGTPSTWRRSSSMRVVHGLDEAIDHIAKYGSQHTDAIVTAGLRRTRMRFLREVDSSSVMVNALDALRRRLRIRAGRRDRHLDQQAARARAGRPRGPDLARSGSCSAGRVRSRCGQTWAGAAPEASTRERV